MLWRFWTLWGSKLNYSFIYSDSIFCRCWWPSMLGPEVELLDHGTFNSSRVWSKPVWHSFWITTLNFPHQRTLPVCNNLQNSPVLLLDHTLLYGYVQLKLPRARSQASLPQIAPSLFNFIPPLHLQPWRASSRACLPFANRSWIQTPQIPALRVIQLCFIDL